MTFRKGATVNTPESMEEAGRGWKRFLIATALVSLYLNIYYALAPKLPDGKLAVTAQEITAAGAIKVSFGDISLALIIGIVPVAIAFWLSDALKDPLVNSWIKFAIITLMLSCMGMSIAHQAEVLRPKMGDFWSLVLPIILDASSMVALNLFMKAKKIAHDAVKKAAEAAEMISIKAEIRDRLEAEARAEIKAEVEAEVRPVIEAEATRKRGAEIEAAEARGRAEAEAEIPALIEAAEEAARTRAEVETTARVRRELTDSKPAGKRSGKGPKATALDPDRRGLSSKDEARILYEENPEISGGELGKSLGLTPDRGRQLLREIKKELVELEAQAPARPPLRSVG